MRRTLVIMVLALASLTTMAQVTNEPKQGNVSVTQSDDISNLVNGPKKQEPAPDPSAQKDNGTTATPEAPSHEATESGEHRESSSGAADNPAPREKPREQREKKEDKTKIPTERDYLDRSGGPVDMSKKVIRGGRKVVGYRVQVFGGGSTRADRQKAEQMGKELKEKMPSQPVYVHFISPRWTCRIGNFRKADHANTLLKTVKKLGYKQACIVKTTVVVKR